MAEKEVVTEKITVEDVGKWAKWYTANKHWVNPLIAAVAVYFGANPANIEKWIPDLSGMIGGDSAVVKRVEKLEVSVEAIAKVVNRHEDKLFPLGGSGDESSEKPIYRE